MRDRYPGPSGTHLFVRAPKRCYPGGGVLVVGLGEYGELTPRGLAEAIRSAAVAHGLDMADANATEPVDLSISAVLVGATGDQGLGVRSAARSIVAGISAANESLGGAGRAARCCYTRLELWERRAPEAELALISLSSRSAAEDEPASFDPDALPAGVTVDPQLRRAEGHLMYGISSSAEQRPWRRVVVTAVPSKNPEDLNLQFEIDRRLAAVGNDVHTVEKRRLARMLAQAVDNPSPDAAVYTTLFELLLPNELKWDLKSAADLQLVVDRTTAEIPWEMLAAPDPRPGVRDALATRAPLTRQLQGPTMHSVDRSDELRALVIGNPPAGSRWPPLPGAYAEALAVVDTLEQYGLHGKVNQLTFKPGDEAPIDTVAQIEAAMFQHQYRIVHVAGHGAYDAEDESRTGVVIGPDDFLTARFLSALRPIPDLVFLNCCHLGRMDEGPIATAGAGDYHRLGASVARELIASGVRAVIAAGWAVDDAAATAFATTFYEQMLRLGSTFGDAVFVARKAAYTASPRSSTWGAYQCYGDSGMRLPASRSSSPPAAPSTIRDALRRIEYQIDRIGSRGAASLSTAVREDCENELKSITHTARQWDWFDDDDGGLLAEQLGCIHADMGDFTNAIKWYETALRHHAAAVSLKTVEQLANLRDRYAASLTRKPDATEADHAKALGLAAQAHDGINVLLSVSGSSERSALVAGHFKRQATVCVGRERIRALREAATNYRAAYTHALKNRRADKAAYALLNFVQLEEILCRLDPRHRTRITGDDLKEVNRVAGKKVPPSDESYWDAVGLADAHMTRELLKGSLQRRVKRLTNLYDDAFARRSTARERSSSVDHLEDLGVLHPDESERSAILSIIAEITRSG